MTGIIDKVRAVQRSAKKPVIMVIGDLMIDHYIWGGATRLSPEAPVPIVNVKNETNTLGGAGNLAQNLVGLGAKVILSGVIGDDAAGKQLTEILKSEGITASTLLTDSKRPTTLKTRVLAGNQQLVRIDREITDHLSPEQETELLQKISTRIADADIIVLSDYNKGLFSDALTQSIIKLAKDNGKKVIIDPKGLNYAKYRGAFIIKPNKKELAEAAKIAKLGNIGDVKIAAKTIFEITDTEYLVVTLSEEGMVILTENNYTLLPVKATEVFDVTGAGDTVLAAIAYFIASGLNVDESCEVANHAAAIVIRRLGSATTTINEIIEDILNDER